MINYTDILHPNSTPASGNGLDKARSGSGLDTGSHDSTSGLANRPTSVAFDPNRPRPQLTERQKQILELVCGGLSNAEIATSLGISQDTVKAELKRLFRKIEVKNRVQAAALAVSMNLL